jgi:hypothetical protein
MVFHLIVEEGPQVGRECLIPEQGVRFGRAAVNDLVIDDPEVSQVHGRLMFKSDGALWVTDFGNRNPTRVNGEPVTEKGLQRGDLVQIGSAVLRVVHAQRNIAETAGSSPDAALDGSAPEGSSPRGFGTLKKTLFIVMLILLAAVFWKLAGRTQTAADAPSAAPPAGGFEFYYEKVKGGPGNIFRYELSLRHNELQVRIDDLKNGVHVSRSGAVSDQMLDGLSRSLEWSAFRELQSEYTGVAPDSYTLYDLALTQGPEYHRVKVFNQLEPEGFKVNRRIIEEFANNQLGLAALSRSPEELRQLAADAFTRARKAYDERDAEYGRLARAIRAFEEVLWYLETIEPKPEYYMEAADSLAAARTELDRRYQDLSFEIERTIKFRDWKKAADQLRTVLELIPDRTDERHQKAKTKLIDVERRVK